MKQQVIKSKNKIVFKNKLEHYRLTHNISVKEMAEKLGVTYSHLRILETQGNFPRGPLRMRMLEALGVSFNELFYEVV